MTPILCLPIHGVTIPTIHPGLLLFTMVEWVLQWDLVGTVDPTGCWVSACKPCHIGEMVCTTAIILILHTLHIPCIHPIPITEVTCPIMVDIIHTAGTTAVFTTLIIGMAIQATPIRVKIK